MSNSPDTPIKSRCRRKTFTIQPHPQQQHDNTIANIHRKGEESDCNKTFIKDLPASVEDLAPPPAVSPPVVPLAPVVGSSLPPLSENPCLSEAKIMEPEGEEILLQDLERPNIDFSTTAEEESVRQTEPEINIGLFLSTKKANERLKQRIARHYASLRMVGIRDDPEHENDAVNKTGSSDSDIFETSIQSSVPSERRANPMMMPFDPELDLLIKEEREAQERLDKIRTHIHYIETSTQIESAELDKEMNELKMKLSKLKGQQKVHTDKIKVIKDATLKAVESKKDLTCRLEVMKQVPILLFKLNTENDDFKCSDREFCHEFCKNPNECCEKRNGVPAGEEPKNSN